MGFEWIRLDDVEICPHENARYVQSFDHDFFTRQTLITATAISQNARGVIWVESNWEETLNYLKFAQGAETYILVSDEYLVSDTERIYNYTKPVSYLDFKNIDRNHRYFRTYQQLVDFIEDKENIKKWIFEHHTRLISMINDSGCDLQHLYLNPYDLVNPQKAPTITKSRTISNAGGNFLLPLEGLHEYKHFGWALNDEMRYEDKIGAAVWRGANSGPFFDVKNKRPNRRDLVLKFSFNSTHDIGLAYANYKDKNNVIGPYILESWVKGKLSTKEQLKYKYILVVEGNEAATNLPWVFLSNSVPIMPVPWVETWKLESFTKPYVHFVPVKDDFDDLTDVIRWCEENEDTCKKISYQSKLFGLQFFNKLRERRLMSSVIQSYANYLNKGERNEQSRQDTCVRIKTS